MPKPITNARLFQAYRYSRLPWSFVLLQFFWNTFCIVFEICKFVIVFIFQLIPIVYSFFVIGIKYIYSVLNSLIEHYSKKKTK